MRTLSLYGVGGTGTDLVSKFVHHQEESVEGFAQVKTYFVDTSRSNVSKEIPDDRVYIYKSLDGQFLDGNGKIRSTNYDVLSDLPTIKRILDTFKPTDLNVVVGAGGGGTGSVVGPLLVSELLRQNKPVVVFLVGSTTSKLDVENTLKTIKTYEQLAKKFETPICVVYRENTPNWSRKQVGDEMVSYLGLFTALFSGQNHGLDTTDVRNFLNYTHVSKYPPRLTALDLYAGDVKLPKDALGISVISLTAESQDVYHEALFDWQVTAVAHPKVVKQLENNIPLNAALFTGHFETIVNNLNELFRKYEAKSSQVSNRSIVSDKDQANDDGIIL